MDNNVGGSTLVQLTAQIVSAYVGHNSTATRDIPGLVSGVHAALSTLGKVEPVAAKPTPAVSVKKTVTPDYLISLEDGRHYKSMKRHLAGRGMTPQDYRTKWGLPADYPMVAPNYAKQRSDLAKAAGLGKLRRTEEPTPTKLAARRATTGKSKTAPLGVGTSAKGRKASK